MTSSTEQHGLDEEFEHKPVPLSHRHRLSSVAAVWFGFPMIITNAVFAGIIAYNLGFSQALLAILIGNAILLAYVGTLSFIAGNTGRSFALQAERTFGKKGYAITSGFLATVVVGWFAFQTGLTGTTVHASFGWNETATIVAATLLYTAVTFIGIRALSIVGMIAAPLYLILGIAALYLIGSEHSLSGVLSLRRRRREWLHVLWRRGHAGGGDVCRFRHDDRGFHPLVEGRQECGLCDSHRISVCQHGRAGVRHCDRMRGSRRSAGDRGRQLHGGADQSWRRAVRYCADFRLCEPRVGVHALPV